MTTPPEPHTYTEAEVVPCSECRKPIRWAITAAGKYAPVDADPHPEGTVVLTGNSPTRCHVDATYPGPRHRSHFATCTNPEKFRRRKRGNPA